MPSHLTLTASWSACAVAIKPTCPFYGSTRQIAVLSKAQRTGFLTPEKADEFLDDLRSLEIVIDDHDVSRIFHDVRQIAVNHRLSGYDAAYLELAQRKGLPLASLDDDLNRAAAAIGVVRAK